MAVTFPTGAVGDTDKQAVLVSGTNIKTINGQSLVGSGNLTFTGVDGNATNSTNIIGGTAGQVPYQSAVGTTAFVTNGTAGQMLTSNGTGAPTWTTPSFVSINNKTAAYTVVASDAGKVINCTSGSFTISLTSAGTLGTGFSVIIWNSSTTSSDTITIDPNASELIDNAATFTLPYKDSVQIVCDGTKWIINNKRAGTTVPNLVGGNVGMIPYQSAVSTTSFIPVGPVGYVLSANGSSTPTWQSLTVAQATLSFNTQTASYTLVLADAGKLIETNVASANTVTIPLNSSVAFPIGTEIIIVQYGTGQTTIAAAAGVTIRSVTSRLKLTNQYSSASLIKRGTDEWYLIGDLSA
jgi:hypothetical protein